MYNDILNWKQSLPILMKNGSQHTMEMFIEKLLSQTKKACYGEMREMVKLSKLECDEDCGDIEGEGQANYCTCGVEKVNNVLDKLIKEISELQEEPSRQGVIGIINNLKEIK